MAAFVSRDSAYHSLKSPACSDWLGAISRQGVHFLGAWLSSEYDAAVLEVLEPQALEQPDARKVSFVSEAQYARDLCGGEQQLNRFSYSTSCDAMALR